jgi:hypothetical protein
MIIFLSEIVLVLPARGFCAQRMRKGLVPGGVKIIGAESRLSKRAAGSVSSCRFLPIGFYVQMQGIKLRPLVRPVLK